MVGVLIRQLSPAIVPASAPTLSLSIVPLTLSATAGRTSPAASRRPASRRRREEVVLSAEDDASSADERAAPSESSVAYLVGGGSAAIELGSARSST